MVAGGQRTADSGQQAEVGSPASTLRALSLHTSTYMASQFRNLEAWQKAVALAIEIYQVCKQFPRSEQFGLVQQMQRAAVSVPSNIAEGRGRATVRDYRNFVLHARGSTYELETQIEIVKLLGYIDEERATALTKAANEVARLINGLIRSLDNQLDP